MIDVMFLVGGVRYEKRNLNVKVLLLFVFF